MRLTVVRPGHVRADLAQRLRRAQGAGHPQGVGALPVDVLPEHGGLLVLADGGEPHDLPGKRHGGHVDREELRLPGPGHAQDQPVPGGVLVVLEHHVLHRLPGDGVPAHVHALGVRGQQFAGGGEDRGQRGLVEGADEELGAVDEDEDAGVVLGQAQTAADLGQVDARGGGGVGHLRPVEGHPPGLVAGAVDQFGAGGAALGPADLVRPALLGRRLGPPALVGVGGDAGLQPARPALAAGLDRDVHEDDVARGHAEGGGDRGLGQAGDGPSRLRGAQQERHVVPHPGVPGGLDDVGAGRVPGLLPHHPRVAREQVGAVVHEYRGLVGDDLGRRVRGRDGEGGTVAAAGVPGERHHQVAGGRPPGGEQAVHPPRSPAGGGLGGDVDGGGQDQRGPAQDFAPGAVLVTLGGQDPAADPGRAGQLHDLVDGAVGIDVGGHGQHGRSKGVGEAFEHDTARRGHQVLLRQRGRAAPRCAGPPVAGWGRGGVSG